MKIPAWMFVAAAGGAAWFFLKRGGASMELTEQILTGNQNLDRFAPRVAELVTAQFGEDQVDIARAIIAIINNESGGRPNYYLGDQTASGGPSIGPMQIYRKTAIDLGLWQPPDGFTDAEARAAYASMAQNEDQGIEWGVKVFASKLRIANGNVPEAIRRYNGAGAAAEAYRAKALQFIASTWLA